MIEMGQCENKTQLGAGRPEGESGFHLKPALTLGTMVTAEVHFPSQSTAQFTSKALSRGKLEQIPHPLSRTGH